MKQIMLILIFSTFFNTLLYSQEYYYYQGKKIELEKVYSKQFVLLNDGKDTISVKDKLLPKYGSTLNYFKRFTIDGDTSVLYWSVLDKAENVETLYDIEEIIYHSSFLKTKDSEPLGLSNIFYVKLNTLSDTNLLRKIAEKNNVTIIGSNQYMPLWFTLTCTKISQGNSLQMANYFYETNIFAAAEPDFVGNFSHQCVNDSLYGQQWGLNNIGQNNGIGGIDINFCEANQITSGNQNIVVAVLDEGVDLHHADLSNLHPFSFNVESSTSPSVLFGSHGTACAGIIGADINNETGITGIAPNSPIMSISVDFSQPNAIVKLTKGFYIAANNGASVISNSWIAGLSNDYLNDAISYALNGGRSGKGCVVVFASGNKNNSSVSYPSSLSSVISVGAISPCGERKSPTSCDEENWGSNYGTGLNIVAPGVFIPTTDISGVLGATSSDYNMAFNGTSAACPFVSGIAALVLSVNPNLTQKQVKDIIEQTAQKIRPDLYNYNTYATRSNGTWNIQMGYGLVDAYAAVQKAKDMDLYIRDVETDNGVEPSNTNGCM